MVYTNSLFNALRVQIKAFILTQMIDGAVGTDPTLEQATDTDLGTQVFIDTLDEVDSTSQVETVIGSLAVGTSEANGNALTEFGIKNGTGGLILRETFTVINKTVDIALFFDGSITFLVTEGV